MKLVYEKILSGENEGFERLIGYDFSIKGTRASIVDRLMHTLFYAKQYNVKM